MKEASPCGLASFLSYLLWQVTKEVALLVKESSLQPQLAGRISGIPHLQVFLLVLLEDVALLAGTNLYSMIRCGIGTYIIEDAAEQFDVYGLSVWLNIFPFHHYNHFSIT